MWSESEIHNFKKIFLDEARRYCQNNEAEKVFDEMFEKVLDEMCEMFEKARSLDFSELHDEKEAIDKMSEKLEMLPGLKAFFKDNIVIDPGLSPEEHFKNGLRLAKEFYRIEQKAH